HYEQQTGKNSLGIYYRYENHECTSTSRYVSFVFLNYRNHVLAHNPPGIGDYRDTLCPRLPAARVNEALYGYSTGAGFCRWNDRKSVGTPIDRANGYGHDFLL